MFCLNPEDGETNEIPKEKKKIHNEESSMFWCIQYWVSTQIGFKAICSENLVVKTPPIYQILTSAVNLTKEVGI